MVSHPPVCASIFWIEYDGCCGISKLVISIIDLMRICDVALSNRIGPRSKREQKGDKYLKNAWLNCCASSTLSIRESSWRTPWWILRCHVGSSLGVVLARINWLMLVSNCCNCVSIVSTLSFHCSNCCSPPRVSLSLLLSSSTCMHSIARCEQRRHEDRFKCQTHLRLRVLHSMLHQSLVVSNGKWAWTWLPMQGVFRRDMYKKKKTWCNMLFPASGTFNPAATPLWRTPWLRLRLHGNHYLSVHA